MSSIWDGFAGAVVGAGASGIIAVLAIVYTRRDQQDLMREELSIRAAHECLAFAHEVRRKVDAYQISGDPFAYDFDRLQNLEASVKADAERFDSYQVVIRPLRIVDRLGYLSEELTLGEQRLRTYRVVKSPAYLDQWAREMGDTLTNLIQELDQYLRYDLERRERRRFPFWRRYRFKRRWPFMRGARLRELLGEDERGLARADYLGD
jgi:hypothetical protein